MGVKVYKNGSWVDTNDLYVYKNGAWTRATSVKVYENGVWTEKMIDYKNMTIDFQTGSGYGGFSANSSNYIKCSGNNITAQIAIQSTQRTTVYFRLTTPSAGHFGYEPELTCDVYVKSNGMLDSSNYAMKVVSLSYTGTEGYFTTGYLYIPQNQAELSASVRKTIDISDNDRVVTEIYLGLYIEKFEGLSNNASVYLEIKNLKVNGIPYGVNTVITP